MKKKVLVMCIACALCASFMTGCGKAPTADSAENTAGQAEVTDTEAKEQSGKKNSKTNKVSVKDLSETSKPIGVSGLKVIKRGSNAYLSGNIINNESKFGETIVACKFEVLDSTGKKIWGGSLKTSKIDVGGSYSVDDSYIGNWDDSIDENAEFTVKITSMEETNPKVEELSDEINSLGYLLNDEKYNSAAAAWEKIKEEYGEDFKSEIKEFEAKMRDAGIDPDNIAAGMSDEAKSAQAQKERDEMYSSAENKIGMAGYASDAERRNKYYTEALNYINNALTKYPDDEGFKSLKETVEKEMNK